MSLLEIGKDLITINSIVYRPHVEYTSGSDGVITGASSISIVNSSRVKSLNVPNSIGGDLVEFKQYPYLLNSLQYTDDGTHAFRPENVETGTDAGDKIPALFHSIQQLAPQIKKNLFNQKVERIGFEHDLALKVGYNKKGHVTHALATANDVSSNILNNASILDDIRHGLRNVSEAYPDGIITWNTSSQDTWNNYTKLKMIKNNLLTSYSSRINNSFYGFTNYNCLNFVRSEGISDQTCLVYPNYSIGNSLQIGKKVPNIASPNEANYRPYFFHQNFTFDFFINPRYTSEADQEFNAGTIFHMSSSFCVSIVTGSSRDLNNQPDKFRILLQLTASSDIDPSTVNLDTISNLDTSASENPIYISDESLLKNHWHRVTIRWGNGVNNNTGSIKIDDNVTMFSYPSSSLLHGNIPNPGEGYDGIFVGNHYKGEASEVKRFFNKTANETHGIFTDRLRGKNNSYSYQHLSPGLGAGGLIGSPSPTEPSNVVFGNRLNAEIHDIKLYSRKLTNEELDKIKNYGVTNSPGSEQGVNYPDFYVPGYFTTNVGRRRVLESPFSYHHDASVSTPSGVFLGTGNGPRTTLEAAYTPTNLNWNMGIGGHYLNAENFCKEFMHGNIPALYGMNVTLATNNVSSTIEYIYNQSAMRARNLLIMPCDNGKCVANYEVLEKDTATNFSRQYVNEYHRYIARAPFTDQTVASSDSLNYSTTARRDKVSIDKLILEKVVNVNNNSVTQNSRLLDSSRYYQTLVSTYPVAKVEDYVISSVLNGQSSDDVTIFSISNSMYGEKIHPESLEIKDTSLTGSFGDVKITLKDDGRGSLYRADALTEHAKWASAGNVFYGEGLAVVMHPSLKYFGKDTHEIKFRGEQTSHVMIVNAPAPRDLVLSSSNDSYRVLSASSDVDDIGEKFVYISAVNVHDENFNVIMRSTLAQPVSKKINDEYLFKIKMDF